MIPHGVWNRDFARGIRQPFMAGGLVLPPSLERTNSSDSLIRSVAPEASVSGCLKSYTVKVGRFTSLLADLHRILNRRKPFCS
jgi:hypothetical protein